MAKGRSGDAGELLRLRACVRGMVQGVGFRYATVRQAAVIGGMTGWVRNEEDGSVLVVAEGPRAGLERLEAWLGHGPSGAIVRSVEAEYLPPAGGLSSFGVAD